MQYIKFLFLTYLGKIRPQLLHYLWASDDEIWKTLFMDTFHFDVPSAQSFCQQHGFTYQEAYWHCDQSALSPAKEMALNSLKRLGYTANHLKGRYWPGEQEEIQFYIKAIQAFGRSQSRATILGAIENCTGIEAVLLSRGLSFDNLTALISVCDSLTLKGFAVQNEDYIRAVQSLMSDRGVLNLSAEKALRHIERLSAYHVKLISRGATRQLVLRNDLSSIQAETYGKLLSFGLKSEHVRLCQWPSTKQLGGTWHSVYGETLYYLVSRHNPPPLTIESAIEEINGLCKDDLSSVLKGLTRPQIQGLSPPKQKALSELQSFGLTAEMLRNTHWPDDENVRNGYDYYSALERLLRKRHVSLEKALEELNGASGYEAFGISWGLTRAQAKRGLSLTERKVYEEVAKFGITIEHIQECEWPTDDWVTEIDDKRWFNSWYWPHTNRQKYDYVDAFKYLIRQRGKNPDESIAILRYATRWQARGIAKGLTMEEMQRLEGYQIEALRDFRHAGLTREDLLDHPIAWHNKFWAPHIIALETLLGGFLWRRNSALQAVKQLRGLTYQETEGFILGKSRHQIISESIGKMYELEKCIQQGAHEKERIPVPSIQYLMLQSNITVAQAFGLKRGLSFDEIQSLKSAKIVALIILKTFGITASMLRQSNWIEEDIAPEQFLDMLQQLMFQGETRFLSALTALNLLHNKSLDCIKVMKSRISGVYQRFLSSPQTPDPDAGASPGRQPPIWVAQEIDQPSRPVTVPDALYRVNFFIR